MGDSLVIIIASQDKVLHLGTLSGATGKLSALDSIALPEVAGSNSSSPMAVSPDRRTLYVAFRGTPPAVLSFRIDYPNRRLDYLGQAPLADSMASIATDATGRWLFSASYGGGKFGINQIGADAIAGGVKQVLDVGPKAHCVVPGLGNRKVFVVSLGTESVLRFAFDPQTGNVDALPPAVVVEKGTGPRHLVFERTGRFAYVVNELSGSVDVYSVDADGVFAPLQTVDITAPGFTGVPQSADIHLTPNGQFLYASDRGSDTLAGFAVDPASGRLSEVTKIAVAPTPRGFAIDPDGRYLVALGEKTAKAAVYAIDQGTGELRLIQEADTGQGPNWVEILPLA
jgi:6-phosphogluconolactonase